MVAERMKLHEVLYSPFLSAQNVRHVQVRVEARELQKACESTSHDRICNSLDKGSTVCPSGWRNLNSWFDVVHFCPTARARICKSN